MPKKKNIPRQTKKTHLKICSNCGTENKISASECVSCEKGRFEPDWVKALRPINRQFSVQITSSSPQFGNTEERITLSKWWPGGRHTFHFPKPNQWEKVVDIINRDLGPKLGWKTSAQLIELATKKGAKSTSRKADIAKLVADYPDFLKELAGAISPEKFSAKDFNSVIETFGEISDVLTNANTGFRDAYLTIVRKLPKQKQRALENLDILLQGWSLNVITNVAQQVRTRLETIEVFEQQINDSRTFEIRGDNSIHRILERAMWLVDEHYWLLHSNKTLRTSIGKEMAKRDKKKYGEKRPDFVCGTVGDKLILLELKKPSHILKLDYLNQLETYMTIAETYLTFRSSRGYLVGSKIDDELKRRLKYRSGFEILFYADIIDSTKKRYHEFLKTLDEN
ncbi:MAG: hypothetical protein JW883_16540 [Deltaproteobacteria bacterium]|nr:hypothetical protein [Deltaproteobacteria bacterium]